MARLVVNVTYPKTSEVDFRVMIASCSQDIGVWKVAWLSIFPRKRYKASLQREKMNCDQQILAIMPDSGCSHIFTVAVNRQGWGIDEQDLLLLRLVVSIRLIKVFSQLTCIRERAEGRIVSIEFSYSVVTIMVLSFWSQCSSWRCWLGVQNCCASIICQIHTWNSMNKVLTVRSEVTVEYTVYIPELTTYNPIGL